MPAALTFREDAENVLIGHGLDPRDAERIAAELSKLAEKRRSAYLTKSDLMIRWNRSERTVRRWIYKLKLNALVLEDWGNGRTILFKADDVDAAERSRTMTALVHPAPSQKL